MDDNAKGIVATFAQEAMRFAHALDAFTNAAKAMSAIATEDGEGYTALRDLGYSDAEIADMLALGVAHVFAPAAMDQSQAARPQGEARLIPMPNASAQAKAGWKYLIDTDEGRGQLWQVPNASPPLFVSTRAGRGKP